MSKAFSPYGITESTSCSHLEGGCSDEKVVRSSETTLFSREDKGIVGSRDDYLKAKQDLRERWFIFALADSQKKLVPT